MTDANAVFMARELLKLGRVRKAAHWVLREDWDAMLERLDNVEFLLRQKRLGFTEPETSSHTMRKGDR